VTRLILVVLVVVAAIGTGTVLWINLSRAPAPDGDLFAVPEEYPTSGGQDLQPRWDAGEEATDAPAN
jgi:hypothetical protein